MGGLRHARGRNAHRRGGPSSPSGYILLDAIIAMVISLIGLAAVMGSLSTLSRVALRQTARVHTIVEQRNADAQSRPIVFQGR